MNTITVLGRICNDLEVVQLQNAKKDVLHFRIAVQRTYPDKNKEYITDFFNATAWGTTANFIAKNFAKGAMILITGELQTSDYEDDEGIERTWYDISINSAYFTGEKAIITKNEQRENDNTYRKRTTRKSK